MEAPVAVECEEIMIMYNRTEYGTMKKAVIIYNGFIKSWNREVRAMSFLWFSPYLSQYPRDDSSAKGKRRRGERGLS